MRKAPSAAHEPKHSDGQPATRVEHQKRGSSMKKFLTIAVLATLVGCEGDAKDDASTGSVVNECPAGKGGSGGTSTTTPSVSCVTSADCPVPAPCLSCPGETVCQPYTATCVEGVCDLNTPKCPTAAGGAGSGGAATGGSGGSGGTGGSLPSGGGAPVGGAGGATSGTGGSGGAP